MKTLVDEIRGIVGEARIRGMYPVVTDAASDLVGRSCWSEEDEAELFTIIADRIEREYMELPLDADGVPIKPGDEVYIVGGYEPHEVFGFLFEHGEALVHIGRRDGTSTDAYLKPEELNRNNHDTLERIGEDAMKTFNDYWGCVGAPCNKCPATVDGKKPHERYASCGSCELAQRLDLLRRQREVLERGQE